MTNAIDARRLVKELESLLESLPSEPVDSVGLKTSERRRLRELIEQTIEALQRTLSGLDPIRQPPHVLDPSDPDVIGKLIADTLLVQPRHSLSAVSTFYGSGVYAIYYTGAFPAYDLITGTDKPIYVGKADPATSDAVSPSSQGTRLWRRLQDHRKTISAATTTLNIKDFECRFLVVKSAWQGTAETYLIDRFKPVWNNEIGICYGFGKHGDSADTRSNTRSPWDTLHPGRKWAGKGNKPNPLSAAKIAALIVAHLKKMAGLS
ncbi:MAG: Eco29kI family restriction endonuclease [Acidobacteriota bacterium]